MNRPALSVIVPTLNEAVALPALLADLAGQQEVTLEVIVVDGGSADGTVKIAEDHFHQGSVTGCCLRTAPGRGRQLNAGAQRARGDRLLFLHADSRLTDDLQLSRALEALNARCEACQSDALAGRFALRFDIPAGDYSLGLFFCESKARLGRPGSIHGDQGLLLSKTFFQAVGPFREDLPVMEDTCFAEQVRRQGEWLLLPGEIITSARRFQVEGFKARQTLNALLMNFLAIGWDDFFARAPAVYRQQDRTRPLQLGPFFDLVAQLLARLPAREQNSLWRATGRYVCRQVWQLGLLLDCRRAWRQGQRTPPPTLRWLPRCVQVAVPLIDHPAGHRLCALGVRIWFARQRRRYGRA
ncbi:MAG: TIGR04283 family arsenosugar biosynthesis glycosyltransferase [Desulfuromonadales bacterium]|jgi:rSAM/selenodomain-associated transferase 2